MADSYTSSLRLRLIEVGTSPNTWGSKLNTDAFTLLDTSIAGLTTKALTVNYTLTSTNGAADEARSFILKFTGTGAYQVTIPSASKVYMVWNGCTGNLTLTTGSGNTAVLSAGEINLVLCDGTNVRPAGSSGTSWKAYIDGLASAVTSVATYTGAVTADQLATGLTTATTSRAFRMGSVYGDGTAKSLPSGWSSTRNSAGIYRVTHNKGNLSYGVIATPAGTSNVVCIRTDEQNNYFDLIAVSITTGLPVDSIVNFQFTYY